MLADDNTVLADDDALGISLDLDRPTDGPRSDRILVAVEAQQAGLRDRGLRRAEPVEPAADTHKLRTLRLEHLPDRSIGQLRVPVRLGMRDTLVEQPCVQLRIARHPQARREQALADIADLVLDLALLPACRRRAGGRLDQVMPAHLQEAPVELAVLADKDALNRRLHVVVDAARAGALEEIESPGVGVEHHLLRLAWIGPHERHPTVTQTDMRHLDRDRHAVHQHNLVAPVELVGFARRKAQRNPGLRRGRLRLAPSRPRAPPAILVRSAEPRHSRPHSRARSAPRRSGSASAARAPASPRSPAIARRADPATGLFSAAAAARAHSETRSLPSGSPCARLCATVETRGRSP